MSTDDDRTEASGEDGSTTGRAELLVGALGGLLVLAALVFLVYQAVAVRDTGPQLRAAVERVATDPSGQHVVHFSVANDGGTTAEAVRVVGQLRRGGAVVEQVSVTLPYVPVESSRTGALVFRADPDDGVLDVRATAYNLP